MKKLDDLLFMIGLFLSITGLTVLGVHFTGPSDLIYGIHMNLLGGSLLAFVGLAMVSGSFLQKE